MDPQDLKSLKIDCCHCGAINDCATLVDSGAPEHVPQQGDIGVCIECVNPFIVNDTYVGRCRALTEDEFNEINEDTKKRIFVAQKFCKAYKEKKKNVS